VRLWEVVKTSGMETKDLKDCLKSVKFAFPNAEYYQGATDRSLRF
jgi:hypothetical protein